MSIFPLFYWLICLFFLGGMPEFNIKLQSDFLYEFINIQNFKVLVLR
jgi:hypothetical protein